MAHDAGTCRHRRVAAAHRPGRQGERCGAVAGRHPGVCEIRVHGFGHVSGHLSAIQMSDFVSRITRRAVQPIVLRKIAPLSTRSGAEATIFSGIGAFLIFFALNPPLDFGPAYVGSPLVKYCFAAFVVLSLGMLLLQHMVFNYSQLTLVFPFVLCLMGLGSLGYSLLLRPGTTTYASALVPMLLCSLPLFIPSARWIDLRADKTVELLRLFALTATLHLAWQLLEAAGMPLVPSHERTFIILFLMIVSSYGGMWRWFAVSLLLVTLSLALRPSSTLAFGGIFALIS